MASGTVSTTCALENDAKVVVRKKGKGPTTLGLAPVQDQGPGFGDGQGTSGEDAIGREPI